MKWSDGGNNNNEGSNSSATKTTTTAASSSIAITASAKHVKHDREIGESLLFWPFNKYTCSSSHLHILDID